MTQDRQRPGKRPRRTRIGSEDTEDSTGIKREWETGRWQLPKEAERDSDRDRDTAEARGP